MHVLIILVNTYLLNHLKYADNILKSIVLYFYLIGLISQIL